MLYAPFVAGVQIILYAGGIMVLFLFVIMLVNLERTQKERQFNKQWLVGIAGGGLRWAALFISVYTTRASALLPRRPRSITPKGSNTQDDCDLLFVTADYMFAFEIASLLLLVAIIGAVVMAKKRI